MALTVALPLYVNSRDFRVITKYANQTVIDYREGVMAAVAVIQDDQGHRSLRVNNRFRMGSTDGAAFEMLQAHTPLLLHPDPRRALFLGLGTAITFRSTGFQPGINADGVELVPEIVDILPYFELTNLPAGSEDRQKIYVADARRFIRATDRSYDVIVADLFHPGRDGAGSLYTLEHFQAVRDRLAQGGVFCQWLPLYQMDETTLKVIIRTFLEVFPHTRAFLADFGIAHPALGLVGAKEPIKYRSDWFAQRVRDDVLKRYLRGLMIRDGVRLFGAYVAGSGDLERLTVDAAINTDDFPVVSFEAPRFTSQQKATSHGRLITLLRSCRPDVSDLIDDDRSDPVFAGRVARYIDARNTYIHGLASAAEDDRHQAIDAFLESTAASVDFATGYAQCLMMAQRQAQTDPDAARRLLARLAVAQPQRPEAHQWLMKLGR